MANPSLIIDLATGYWKSRSFLAAVELGVFKEIGADGTSASSLSEKTGIEPHQLRLLLGVLHELELVSCNEDFSLVQHSDLSATFLAPESKSCMVKSLGYSKEMYPVWDSLEQRLCSPITKSPLPSKKDTPTFLKSMHDRAQMLIPVVLPLLNIQAKNELLDIAAGAGSWSLAIQLKCGVSKCCLLEQPELMSDTEAFITELGLKESQFVGADYHEWTSDRKWDSVLFFGALHQDPVPSLSEVFEQLLGHVAKGGKLYVLDLFYAPEERGALFAYLFGLNISLTSSGSIHSLPDTVAILEKSEQVSEVSYDRVPGEMPYYLISIEK